MNWHRRIEQAKNVGCFDLGDMVSAAKWVTCACGDQDPRIPRDLDGAPLDGELNELGMHFYWAVRTGDIGDAVRTLDDIEKRAGEILASLEAA